MKRLDFLFEKRDATALGLFRIVFSFLVLIDFVRWYKIDFVKAFLTEPFYLSPYPFLEFLKPSDPVLMEALFFLAMIFILLVMIGVGYRFSIAAFSLIFFYLYYMDETIYNNHLYLVSMISFVMIFIPMNCRLSLSKSDCNSVPAWTYWFFRFLIIIVYFFGGVAKLNYDWLVLMEPVRTMMSLKGIESEIMIYIVTYGGLIFDLSIGFFLLFKKSRNLAFIGVVIFNLMNGLFLFDDIFIFPFLMIAATVLFYPPEQIANALRSFSAKRTNKKNAKKRKPDYKGRVVVLLAIFFILQLTIPFKHFLFKGNSDWTMQGQRFCWHMKTQSRTPQHVSFFIENKNIPRGPGNPEEFVLIRNGIPDEKMISGFGFRSDDKLRALYYNPRSALYCAQSMGQYFKKLTGVNELGVYTDIRVGFNGRQAQQMIDPNIDLLKTEYDPFGKNSWIVPLKNPDGGL